MKTIRTLAVLRAALAVTVIALAAPAADAATYAWSVTSGSFTNPASWSPARIAPAASDVLVFDGSTMPVTTVTVSDVPTQTIGQLVVNHGAAVTFTATAAVTLTLGGGAGTDLDVDGASLTTSGTAVTNAIVIALGPGATGTVRNAAVYTLHGPSQKLVPVDTDALHFQSGSRFVEDVTTTGNPFNNTGNVDAAVFEATSVFVYRAGSNPFALAAPSSRVVFQAGSVFRQETGSLPSVAGRTYADFELDTGLGSVTITAANNTWTVDNIRCLTGTLNLVGSATGTMTVSLRGGVSAAPGAVFNFSPSTLPGTLSLDGTGSQDFTSTNDAVAATGNLTLGPLSNVVVGPASSLRVVSGDLVAQGTLSFGNKVTCLGASRLVMAPGSTFSPGLSAWVDGALALVVPAGGPVAVTFPVGDAAAATPVRLDFASVSSSGRFVARANAGDHPVLVGSGLDAASSVNRWWRVGADGGALTPPVFSTCDVTLNYLPSDLDGGAIPGSFIVGKFDSPAWTLPAHTAGTPTSIQATGLTSFSEFAVADPSPCPVLTVLPASLPPGNSGSSYSQSLTATGGTGPYTFAVVIGSLPPGLSLAAGGALTGTPSVAGTYAFTVSATDVGGCAGAGSYSLVVNGPCPAISLTPPTLPDGIIGTGYGQSLTASGGTPPYSYALVAGGLPPGLSLSGSGVLSGTLAALGSYAFDVRATDANGCTGDASYSVEVTCPTVLVFPTIFLAGIVGSSFTATVTGSGGIAPYTFAVTSGSLPPGLTLASGGALTGTPTAGGTYPFTITGTDANGCSGNRSYSFITVCPALSLAPAGLPNPTQGTPYSETFSASGGSSPYAYSVTAGALPTGLTLSPGGTLAGTPTVAGPSSFTVTATDAFGCATSLPYVLYVAPADLVTAGPATTCITSTTPCIVVPVRFSRYDTTPVRGYSVTIELSPELMLCGPQAVSGGYLPPGSGGAAFFITPDGPNRWIVDETTLGDPCGATGDGTLFDLHVTSSSPSYTSGTIQVTDATVRDCANGPVPANPSGVAAVSIDWTAPTAIANLGAAQQKTGNDADGTTRIVLSWTPPFDAVSVEVWRKPYGGYPQYDENGGAVPVAPASPAAAATAGWTLTGVTASGQSDEPPSRDFWYYVAFSHDACGNVSPVSNLTPGTLDYHLGDVSNGVATCSGNNAVSTADLSLLGANYHVHPPLNGALECLDVGPTTDHSVDARPTTDNFLDFEDLILFSINYGQVSAPRLAATPARDEAPAIANDAVWVEAPNEAATGQRFTARIRVRGAGDLQGLSTALRWDPAVARPSGFQPGDWLPSQGGLVLAAGDGGADGVMLGLGSGGMTGEGTLAIVEFEALRAGDPGIALARADGRDASNRPVTLDGEPADVRPGLPARTGLGPASPNPFRGGTSFRVSLASEGPVRLTVYDLGGRHVRTLLDGVLPAGERVVAWDGRDDSGVALSPGLFVVRLAAAGVTQGHRVLLVR